MKQLPLFLLAALCLSLLLPSCENLDGNYSVNPNHRLSFSVDTLSFDTIFSTVGSTTKHFMVYNRNSEPLDIEFIQLEGAETTGFRINVDGRKGSRFEHIGIRPKDSLYVFVEVTVDPNGGNQPLLIEDYVSFSVNGQRQRILLEAYGQDTHLYKGGKTFDSDTTLTADRPYLIYDSLVIASGATVRLAEGVTFYMHDKADIIVYGTLTADGTQESPVTIRGDRLDDILEDLLPYDREPAQWGGILFRPESYGNRLEHTIVRSGTTGLTCQPASPDVSKLILSNSQITNMNGNLLTAINCRMEATNTELSNATGIIVSLTGGDYRFVHCTLASHITLFSRRDTAYTLALSATLPDKQSAPLTASFDNCIIDGSRSAGSTPFGGELMLDKPADGIAFNYRFNHCLIKTKGEENDNFTGNLFIDNSPEYRMTGTENDKYAFDFRLDSVATAGVGKADPAVAALYPVDRYGISRLTSPNGPSMGAYEFVPKEEKEEADEKASK
ncbi:hypothetical protein Barb4_01408 [Bacteroidales bacterium Barb4]|nr:hypothetical protein Barb4_01408 [Bacteroidales bacterium Barb4]